MFRPWLVALVGLLLAASSVEGAGFYNMPSSLRQCVGYGVGPGYHAPLCLGPAEQAGIASKPLIRTRAGYLHRAADRVFTAPSMLGIEPPSETLTPGGYWHGCL